MISNFVKTKKESMLIYARNFADLLDIQDLENIENFMIYDIINDTMIYGLLYKSKIRTDWKNESFYIYRVDGKEGSEFRSQLILNFSKYIDSALHFMCFRYTYNKKLLNSIFWRGFPKTNAITKILARRGEEFLKKAEDTKNSVNLLFKIEKNGIEKCGEISRIYIAYSYVEKSYRIYTHESLKQ